MQNPTSLRMRLRTETQDLHEGVEKAVGFGHLSDPQSYRRLLERFYGFYQSFEKQLLQASQPETLRQFYSAERHRTSWLRQDLQNLGASEHELANLPTLQVPPPPNPEAWWGAIYVIEGSSLGGQVLTQKCRSFLPQIAEFHFFNSYGARTGQRWQETVRWIETWPTQGLSEDSVVAGARWTFELMRDWFLEQPPKSN